MAEHMSLSLQFLRFFGAKSVVITAGADTDHGRPLPAFLLPPLALP